LHEPPSDLDKQGLAAFTALVEGWLFHRQREAVAVVLGSGEKKQEGAFAGYGMAEGIPLRNSS
jgi:hypothetical protein